MDAAPNAQPKPAAWRPDGIDHIALVLQGGGALGAYQAGVYEALHEAGIEPDWLAGVSIGGINAAIIAGNRPENRLDRLRIFWDSIITREIWPFSVDGDDPRKARNVWSSFITLLAGQPNFFKPHLVNPWLNIRGARTATSFYSSAPLRETLLRVVDFDLLNRKATRYAAGAVNVLSGNFYYFDNHEADILPEHVMASGALPPALPMVQIGTDYYWDGGLVSNTPLQHVLDNLKHQHTLIFQVDLFSALGALPRDMYDVLARQKDIQYSSRTRMVTDYYLDKYKQNVTIKQLLAKVPEDALTEQERALRDSLSELPETTILHLIYQQAAYEGQSKDYDFSASSMREHWASGYRDTQRTLRHKEWLTVGGRARGITVHDVHRAEADAR
jgi:NTE family protein